MNDRRSVTLRRAVVADAPAISALIVSLADGFFAEPGGGGAEGFLASVSQAAEAGYLADDRYRFMAATDAGQLVGFIALRDRTHVFHLFVAPAWQRRGVASMLWHGAREDALAEGPLECFTVNAALPAVPVYSAFGFEPSAPVAQSNGVRFLPMRRPEPAAASPG